MTITRYSFVSLVGLLLVVATDVRHSTAALLARYEFEGNFLDSSGNGHHGVAGGTVPTIVTDPHRGLVLRTASTNSFVDMSGTLPIPNFAPETSITMAAWVKRYAVPDADNFRYVMNLGANGNSPIATLGIHGSGVVVGYIETDEPVSNGDQVNVLGSRIVESNAAAWTSWHHIAVVYDRTTDLAHTYLDGIRDTTVSISLLSDIYGQSWNGPATTGVPATQFARIGRGSSTGVQMFIDDANLYTSALTDQEILELMGGPVVTATVDRGTGKIELTNIGVGAGEISAYSISSASGSLLSTNWLSIADNYDGDDGSEFDDGIWVTLSAPSNRALLSETATGGSTGTMAANETQTLDLGNAWLKSPIEDLQISVTYGDGRIGVTTVQFTGGPNDAPFARSDLNFDGVVDENDWLEFFPNMLTSQAGLSSTERYQNGDLDRNGVIDVMDFSLFKLDFDVAQGAGAFDAMLAGTSVPEPATWGLLFCGIMGLVAHRFRRRAALSAAAVLAAGALSNCPMTASAVALDFTQFTAESYPKTATFPTAVWTAPAGFPAELFVTHNSNASVSVFYGPEANNVLNKRIIGRVTPGTDDDHFGFVFGFQPNYAAGYDPNAEYMLMDWKGVTQNWDFLDDPPENMFHDLTGGTFTANVGLALSRINALPNADELWSHTDQIGNTSGGVTEITRAATLGATAYNRTGGFHVFDIRYTANNITVLVDGVQQFNYTPDNSSYFVDGVEHFHDVLPDGRFGLYTLNQGPPTTFWGFEMLPVDYVELSAVVDRSNGEIVLKNTGTADVTLDYYEFTSDSNSLHAGNWDGLDDFQSVGPGDHQKWQKAGGSNSAHIAEMFLASHSTIAGGTEQSIGGAYDFAGNPEEDLVFNYRLPGSGVIFQGLVSYINEAPTGAMGDYNGDGLINAADYALWRDNPSNFGGNPGGYNTWKANFGLSPGSGSSASANVPEPSSIAMLCGLAILFSARRFGRRFV